MAEFFTKQTANDIQHGGDHYKRFPEFEPWDVITAWGLGYLDGTALKYIARWRHKNGIEDLNKAIHFLQKAVEVETALNTPVGLEWPFNVATLGHPEGFTRAVGGFCDVCDVDGEAWHSQPFPSGSLNTMPILRADSDDV